MYGFQQFALKCVTKVKHPFLDLISTHAEFERIRTEQNRTEQNLKFELNWNNLIRCSDLLALPGEILSK